MSFQSKVWQTLSAINVSEEKKEKAGKYTYISWSWAVQILKDVYPESTIKVEDNVTYPDGTMEVRMSVTVREGNNSTKQTMWLPVMGDRNNAIANPNSRQINDARMRCLTKCIALHGLALYLYAGEDIPVPEAQEIKEAEEQVINEEQVKTISGLLKKAGITEEAFCETAKIETLAWLQNKKYDGAVDWLKKAVTHRAKEGNTNESK